MKSADLVTPEDYERLEEIIHTTLRTPGSPGSLRYGSAARTAAAAASWEG